MSAVQLTSIQRTFFAQNGYLRLEQAVTQRQLQPVQRRINHDLGRRGIDSMGRGLPNTIRSLPVFQQIGKLSQLVQLADLATALIPAELEEMVRALARQTLSNLAAQVYPTVESSARCCLDEQTISLHLVQTSFA